MTFVLIALLILTIIYNIYAIYLNKGIPESISDTAYIFDKKRYYFSIYCVLLVTGLLPIWLGVSIVNLQCLVFICCVGILFAGITPFFKDKGTVDKPIHYSSGIIVALAYLLWLIFSGYAIILIPISIILSLLIIIDYKNFIYYIEIVGLISLLILLFII